MRNSRYFFRRIPLDTSHLARTSFRALGIAELVHAPLFHALAVASVVFAFSGKTAFIDEGFLLAPRHAI
jgi:hypothetical protein